jgi:predicted transport protein
MTNLLLVDGVKFDLWTPKDEEKEFHPLVKAHHKEIFGEDAFYFDVKHVLKSPSKIGSIPDAYLVSFGHDEWYVVENELSSHPIYDHIVNQLSKFLNGIKNQDARSQILDALYEDINSDVLRRAEVEKQIDSRDVYHALSKLITKQPRMVVIIDRKTPEIEEALQNLSPTPSIVEFKTYARRDAPNVRAFVFEPLYGTEKPTGKTQGKTEGKKTMPEYYRIWQKKLEWVSENVRETTKSLIAQVIQFDNVVHKASGPDYVFYKGQPGRKTIFLGLFLTKSALKVRIRTDPATFKDPKKWVGDREYRWFFKVGEKEFSIASVDQIEYAMGLIKQSYQLAK